MTDFSGAEPTKRKRGRPPGSGVEKRRKLLPKHEESDSDRADSDVAVTCANHTSNSTQKLLQKYQEALKVYEQTVFNSHTHHLLRRVATEPALQQRSQQEPALHQLMDVAKKTLLSEVELTVWALHLGRASVSSAPMSLHAAFLVSAFYVKSSLGSETAPVRAFLEKQQSSFAANLATWEKTYPKETLAFSLHEVNSKWKQLNKPISEEDVPIINYNYYVDDILQAGITPVDSFTTSGPKPWWTCETLLQSCPSPSLEPPEPAQLRPIKPVATPLPAYEPVFAKECEEFSFAPIQWFEPVPVSPGLLFFNFPSPPVSALLQPMEENFDSRALPHIGQ